MLTACFTGVESTKAITQKDVKRAYEGSTEAVDADRGKLYAATPAPFVEWQHGKRFFVTDDNVKLLFAPTAAMAGNTSLQQHYLSYRGYGTDTSIDGKECVTIDFADESGNEYKLPTGKTLDELKNPYTIPFLIDMDEVLELRSMLTGKEVYVKTPLWYDSEGNAINGRRYVKVRILDVLPGNKVFAYRLRFSDEEKQVEAFVYMSSAQSSVQNRTYTDLFSDTDVRLRYPEINDENWACIVRGDVAIGMTKDECRLSLGSPKTLNRRPTYDGVVEYWSYDNGVYLIFEDGLLARYRK